ncbi:MAG: DNRLRE domain-containing protein [Acutalibacteraceae bacterium]|nr:DNRLRE domain-containing protein [Acutalibacteraceae bacterium]
MKVKFERCKKIFSMFLIIVLLFGILPVSALQRNVSDSTTSRIVKEIVEMREESVKYFICEDGSYIAATYSSPVHYEESGKWEEIDNTLTLNTKSGEAVYSTKNGFDVTIPQNLTGGRSITATNKGYTVSFKIKGDTNGLNMRTTASVVDTDKLPSVVKMNDTVKMTGEVSSSVDISSSGTLTEGQKIEKFNAEKMTVENQTSAVVYKNFLNRSDLEYVVTSNSLKENIVVYAPQSEYIYRFDLDSGGLMPAEQADGSIKWVDPKNPDETVFLLDAPYMYDANDNESFDVSMSVEADGDGYVLTVRADSDWIGESGRAFPVVIDPSWSIPKSNFKDVYVINGICANEPRAIKEIRAGRNLTNTVRSYVKIEMPENLPAGSVITGGELTFRKQNYFKALGHNDIDILVYDCKDVADWSETTVCWNAQPFDNSRNGYLNNNAELIDSIPATSDLDSYSFDLTEAVKRWVYTGINKGIMIASSDEVTRTQVDFYSSRASKIEKRPVMSISFDAPRVSTQVWNPGAGATTSSLINVVSSSPWTVDVSDVPWLSVASVTDDGFKLRAQSNPYADVRTGTVVVKMTADSTEIGRITITQLGTEPAVVLDRDRWDVDESGEHERLVEVSSNASWSVSTDSSWITLDKTSGRGNSTFTMSIETPNETHTTRTGTVTVQAGDVVETIVVTQFDEVSGYFNSIGEDGVSRVKSSSEYNHKLSKWAMELAYAAYNPLTGPIAGLVPGIFMEDDIPTATELLESEGFNVQSFNYGESDTVAHVIAHRNITAELSVSDICEDNDLYFGGNENDSFRECDRNNYCVDNGSVYILRIGFDRNIGSNSQYVLNEAVNAQNQLNNNEDRTLVVVDVRGSETLQDWITNMGSQAGSDSQSFETGKNMVLTSLLHGTGDTASCLGCNGAGCAICMGYIPYYNIHNPIVLVTGHSLGAAVANLVAAHLSTCNDANCCGFLNGDGTDVYGYTFATPNTVDTNEEGSIVYTGDNIYNILNNNDAVTFVPRTVDFSDWRNTTWKRHGVDLRITMPMSIDKLLLRRLSTAAIGAGGHAMSTYNDWLAALPDKLGKTADDIDLNDLLALTDNRDELGLLPKILWAKCPVSVTLKDEDGNVLAFESSNANAVSPQLANSSGIVSLVTDNNEKVFLIPFGYETVDISIEAYDYGTMTFSTEVAGLGSAFNKTYNNINLYPGKQFTAQIAENSLVEDIQPVHVDENGEQIPVEENPLLKSAVIDNPRVPYGTYSIITVVTDKSVIKVRFICRANGATITYTPDNEGVISYIDNGDTLTWVIRRKFASGTVDYDVGVKVGNVWYVTPNVFTLTVY